ncbi:ATP-dependent RNA helicase DBP9 [Elsinoe ampelina]|uniref:RNA helicase n=1 Tax=Elsinoe ampelina TaxID=302913 RepID=A0A6A6GFF1_9PEZI|nr:ATP-dependent RNA helicase DBP9 [Elsinoe ampelina]
MKRKLSDREAPEATTPSQPAATPTSPPPPPPSTKSNKPAPSFSTLPLDPRLLQSLTAQQFSAPTPIQSRAIPLLLQGKDVLARARTGSGKTAAYALPLLHRILAQKSTGNDTGKKVSGLILVPTKELAAQVTKAVAAFAQFCGQMVKVENLTRKEEEGVLRARVAGGPDVVVATPSRALGLVNAGVLGLEGLVGCVIDEADLVLSYGHEEDLKALSEVVPEGTQMVLVSATLRKEVETLKALFCPQAVVLEMEDREEEGKLRQFVVKCGEDEKFLLAYAIFMLKLIKGKVIVFVADIDRCYRLKLFLEQFGIRSCVLNSELPANSRIHAVEEFNRNVYDIIIASDENEVVGSEERKTEEQDEPVADDKPSAPAAEEDEEQTELGDAVPKKKRKRSNRDAEYGISRGIDFKNVSCVLNFDLPLSSKSYIHRIGRTARAGKTGMALSFCVPKTLFRKHKPTSIAQCANDEEVLTKITNSQEKKGQKIEPYDFDMKRLDGFRYRMADALRSVTGVAVREARTKEIRQELIKSEKLKRHFEENPEDLEALRHDKETHTVRVQQHLKHIPEYLLPGGAKSVTQGNVGFSKIGENRIRAARKRNAMKSKKGGKKKAGKDPLKSLGRK